MLDNRHRIYALESWTAEKKARGWFIKRTHSSGATLGPFRNETSVCLMIARQLRKELLRRDSPPPTLLLK